MSLISFILIKFSVQRLNILISGGTGKATFSSQRGNSNIACLLSLCKAFPIFLQQHSLRAAMANIIKCPANTLPSLHTHTYTQTNTRTKPPLPSLYPHSFSPSFSSWLSLSGSARGKESALICQSEQPFHRARLRGAPVPEWELLISPGRLAYSRLLGSPAREGQRGGEGVQESGPWSGLGRREIRAPHAAPACTYHCCWSSASPSVFHTLICTYT